MRHIHGVMLKFMFLMTKAIDKLLAVDGDEAKEAQSRLVDSATLLVQAMGKTSHFRVNTSMP